MLSVRYIIATAYILIVAIFVQSAAVTNVSVPLLFSYQVIQQPSNKPGFVSLEDNRVTEFGPALIYGGSRGLLADNRLAGSFFFGVRLGDIITVNYADETKEEYEVVRLRHFQALTPTSPYSNFIDLTDGQFYTASQLFYATYGIEGALILQTCIAREEEWAWGRLFIISAKYKPFHEPNIVWK